MVFVCAKGINAMSYDEVSFAIAFLHRHTRAELIPGISFNEVDIDVAFFQFHRRTSL
jgi:hypothetical protein